MIVRCVVERIPQSALFTCKSGLVEGDHTVMCMHVYVMYIHVEN